MRKKITWKMVYSDFRLRFPNFKKQAIHWQPYDYMTIVLHLKDGGRCTYCYLDRKITFLKNERSDH